KGVGKAATKEVAKGVGKAATMLMRQGSRQKLTRQESKQELIRQGSKQGSKQKKLFKENVIKFSYKLVPGISEIKAAKLILMQMGFPSDVLSVFDHDDE
ncbi:MAG: hypothetical protein ACKPKO_13305, partial [Candidatus Fonsibacter sp.]